jgi:predicted TIM-barrel fold metal-dependent hydrolase
MVRLAVVLMALVSALSCASTFSQETSSPSKSGSRRIYLDEFRPKAELRAEEHLLTRARFPCVNVHSHPGTLSDEAIAEMVQVMDASNIAVSVSLDGQVGSRLTEQLQRFTVKYPGRFVIFVRMDFVGDGDPEDPATWAMHRPNFGAWMADQLSESVKLGAGGLKLLKDLGLKHKDLSGRLIAPDDKRFDPIWQRAGELGVPVLWHCADPVAFFRDGDLTNERWEELHRHPEWSFRDVDLSHLPPPADLPPGVPAAHRQLIEARNRVIARHPKTQFICAHMADIPEDLALLDRYLSTFPNMHVEISARVSELGRQPYTARKFLLKHSDRILFGTDGVPPISELDPHWRFLETFDENFPYEDNPFPPQGFWNIHGIGLPDEVLRKVYSENAARLIPPVKRALELNQRTGRP